MALISETEPPPSKSQSVFGLRWLRIGFLLVVAMLTSTAGFLMWSNARTSGRVDRLVAASLERERLIGLIRLDAALLAQAADDHIGAADDEERKSADQAMQVILREIQAAIDQGTAETPRDEALTWLQLKETAANLVKTVAVTVKYSNRREAERAKKHLEEEVKPINFELDELADRLARENTEETRLLLHSLQDIRKNAIFLGALVLSLAALFSLLVAFQVSGLLKRQETTIVDQMGELGRRNQELDAFASRVAHDLISPLSPLKGYLTLARRGSTDTEIQELLAQAESSTTRMSELVDALLRFCRAGKPTDRAFGELDTAVSTILLEQSQAADAAKVKLERQLERDVTVRCAPGLLQSISGNLLTNAVKYTAGSADAAVAVRVFRDRGQAVLEVKDNGPGMSDQSRKLLFTPFFRAPEARGLPGYGLGLATTKRLVEGHGGTIGVATALGKGTTVTVRLPLGDRSAIAATVSGEIPALGK
ncbi:MAG: HAMP domain-containing sensor histidine kinase [Myxococcaceae bacterium]